MTFIFLVTLFCLFSIQKSIPIHKIDLSAQERKISLSSKLLQYINLGQKRLISSIIWIETLMNADTEHFDESEGEHSWLFYRFRGIVTIDPKFYEAYLYGAKYLSIIKDEPKGAQIILDKGLDVYPSDYWLHYYAAYNQYIELKNPADSLRHYRFLVNHPKSRKHPIIHGLYSRILAQEDSEEDAYWVMYNMYQQLEDPTLKDIYKRRLEKLERKRGP